MVRVGQAWNDFDRTKAGPKIIRLLISLRDASALLSKLGKLWVFKENSYASRTIEIAKDQKVVTTGPYSIIRHPMYLGSLIMCLLTPVALGSWRAVPIFSLNILIFIWRIQNEEKVLLGDLPRYYEYCQERHYRLLPLIW